MSLLVRKERGDQKWDEVTRSWEGKTCVCIASGPSVTLQQLDLIKAARARDAVRVIVVNDMYLVAPWADAMYFADKAWWEWHRAGLEKVWPWARFSKVDVVAALENFAGQKITIKHNPMAEGPDIFALENAGFEGLSTHPKAIRSGGNSGYQALNIAALSGANPILLVGYDMKYSGNRTHSHTGHPGNHGTDHTYRRFGTNFSFMENPLKQLGIKVINCSTDSELNAFPRGRLEDCLAGRTAALPAGEEMSAYNGFKPLWTQVSETLWFGGTPEADPSRYDRFKFMVDCVGTGPRHRRGNAAILSAPFPDTIAPPRDFIFSLADFAAAGMKQGFTLIHCQQGHNRSGLIAAVALIRSGLVPKLDVIRFLREKRKPEVLTNPAFAHFIETL